MNACKPHAAPALSAVSILREKLYLSSSMVDGFPPLLRECVKVLEERGTIEIREAG